MKIYKNITRVILTMAIVMLALSCDEQFDIKNGGSFAAQIYPPASANYLKGETTTISIPFNTFINEGQSVTGYNVYKKLTAGGVSSDEVKYSVNGDSFSQSASELFADVPVGGDVLSEDDLNPGDRWVMRYEIVMSDGRTLSVGAKTNLNFTCPSALAGNYNGVTNWVDYYGNPGTDDYVTTITNSTLAGEYVLEDLSGGMEPIVWGNPPVEAIIKDICDRISLVSAPYFYPYYITDGSVSDVGVISITWRNAYDENGVTTLTPQ